jgi:hypothetical protein
MKFFLHGFLLNRCALVGLPEARLSCKRYRYSCCNACGHPDAHVVSGGAHGCADGGSKGDGHGE